MKICQGEGGKKGCIAPVTHWCFAGEGQGHGLLATAAPGDSFGCTSRSHGAVISYERGAAKASQSPSAFLEHAGRCTDVLCSAHFSSAQRC